MINFLSLNRGRQTEFKLGILSTILLILNKIQLGECDFKYENYDLIINKTIVNPHDFKYLINPGNKVCGDDKGKNVSIITYVHTSPAYFNRRQSIRETWGKRSMFPDNRIIFTMGATDDKSVNDLLRLESSEYNDIVQEDFHDSYKNLTYKGIMAMKWITENCANAKFILKTDDDIIVDMFKLSRHLYFVNKRKVKPVKKIFCLFWGRMPVQRHPRNKWFMSKEDYKFDYFPDYCSGSAFYFTSDLAPLLYNVSLHIKFVWVDDYYVTGLLVRGVNGTHVPQYYSYALSALDVAPKFLEENSVIIFGHFGHSYPINRMYNTWNIVINYHRNFHQNIMGISNNGDYFHDYDFKW